MIDETHDPALRSWVESANEPGADFPIQNLAFGAFRRRGTSRSPRLGVAIGNQILDLSACRERGLFSGLTNALQHATTTASLNELMALGPDASTELRRRLSQILRADAQPRKDLLLTLDEAEVGMPATIGDFTDYYASIFHARNVGSLFRSNNPLFPNYKHLPIAYHGRSSSIVPTGTGVHRPWGQVKRADDPSPVYRPTDRLDYEAEVAAFVGLGNKLGTPVALDSAERHIFGLCLLNDWSARDIQMWESQPLGPFLAKDFATTISPWVVTLEALAPFRCPHAVRPTDDPPLLPYLSGPLNAAAGGIDLTVEVYLRSARMREERTAPLRVSHGSFRNMYWTFAQMVAHHTSNGCNLQPGDLIASGTVSGPDEHSRGCLLEITQGTQPLTLPSGETRLFLADGDEVIVRGFCEREGCARIGFGECAGTILAANTVVGW